MDAQILLRFLKRNTASFVNSEFWRSLSAHARAINECSTGRKLVAPQYIATRHSIVSLPYGSESAQAGCAPIHCNSHTRERIDS